MTPLDELTLEEAAKEAAGNWKEFPDFAWFRSRELDDPENWAVLYTHNRDSGLLARSNAAAVEKALEPFTEGDDPDAVPEHHTHWACGWIDGYSIRVFKAGEITDAFKAYYELVQRMADYPVFDEEDYSRRGYEATLDNVSAMGWKFADDYALPEDWPAKVHEWLAENNESAVEDADDQGGCPSFDEVGAAIKALGYPRKGG